MLEHNNIRSLSRRLFRDLISLKHLNVAGKSLTSIQARAFENIQDPKYLWIIFLIDFCFIYLFDAKYYFWNNI